MDAAERIVDAFDSRRTIPLLTEDDPTFDLAAAYALADQVRSCRRARGEHPVGRKIGVTNRAVWDAMGASAPIWAWVYDTTVHDVAAASARLDLAPMIRPRLEPEIQLHFARTPPLTDDVEAVLACIDWIAHGFEIVQSPFESWMGPLPDIVAAYGLHGGLVVGPHVAVADVDDCAERLASFTIVLERDGGEPRLEGGGRLVLDSPLAAFTEMAKVLADQGAPPVEAGEIVTTGTLTLPVEIRPGETWRTSIAGIDLPGMEIGFV
jgi:2-oxo-3-hexenedioate decarboxylase